MLLLIVHVPVLGKTVKSEETPFFISLRCNRGLPYPPRPPPGAALLMLMRATD